ncbi:hypothetical protein HPB47_011172 [Ixodes persulcatus]|uniref:Uncharacterized protein n=1 Tax=Ixodes persulcatus TaxID=34615 RepID=A0AC60NX02_IXOPE|nr:hypothetical protein HPB47_011172 [Ixodes persulcatus]
MLSRQFITDARKYLPIYRVVANTHATPKACVKRAAARHYGGGGGGHKPVPFKPPTMDDLPTFSGPWQEMYNATQSRFNRQLLLGVAFFAGTALYVWYLDIVDFVEAPPMKNPSEKTAKVSKTLGGRSVLPASHTKLPEEVPYLLVGAGTASFAAFRAIRSADPTAKVLVIGDEPYMPYMRPPLSKELWLADDAAKQLSFKQWNGKERSIFFEHDDFYCRPEDLMGRDTGGIAVVNNCRVVRVDSESRKAYLEDGREIRYGKCLIATGGRPKTLSVLDRPEFADKVTLFRTVADFKALDDLSRKAKSVVIVGGGFLGSELACALGRRARKTNLVVYQVFPEKGNMGRILPEYLSRWTMRKVRDEGVKVLEGISVTDAQPGPRGQVSLTLSSGETIVTDHVIVAVGLTPDTELAKASGLEVDDRHGGFKANAELEARSNLWIAGDALSFYDPKLGRRRVEHHDHAVVTGRLAGENMTGARKPYRHQSMFWSDIGPDVGYEAIGIVDSNLPTVGVFAKITQQELSSKAAAEGAIAAAAAAPATTQQPAATQKDDVPRPPELGDDFSKGVVFYLREDGVVVGIVLWNVFNRMAVARKIINEHKAYTDFSELAKLFDIHGED